MKKDKSVVCIELLKSQAYQIKQISDSHRVLPCSFCNQKFEVGDRNHAMIACATTKRYFLEGHIKIGIVCAKCFEKIQKLFKK